MVDVDVSAGRESIRSGWGVHAWMAIMDAPVSRRPWLTDGEACTAADTTVRTLQMLQTEGAIRSTKVQKSCGGFRRVWGTDMMYLAAVAGDLIAQFDLSIAKAAAVLKLIDGRNIRPMVFDSVSGWTNDATDCRQKDDWILSIYDREFASITTSQATAKRLRVMIRDTDTQQDAVEFPIGIISGETAIRVMYELESRDAFNAYADEHGRDKAFLHGDILTACKASMNEAVSCMWCNLSMSIRKASRRIGVFDVKLPPR